MFLKAVQRDWRLLLASINETFNFDLDTKVFIMMLKYMQIRFCYKPSTSEYVHIKMFNNESKSNEQ